MFWIRYYCSTDPSKGYNCTNGGDGCSIAREIKDSTRDKISKAKQVIEITKQQPISNNSNTVIKFNLPVK